MLTAREMAVGIISGHKIRMLEDAGLTVVFQEQKTVPRYTRYPVGKKKVIGKVYVLDEQDTFPVVDHDENGFEIVFATSHGFMWTEWFGAQNCGIFEVIT